MRSESYERNDYPTTIGYLHVFFCFIYIVLVADIVLLSLHQNLDFPAVPMLDKLAALFYEPFSGDYDLDILEAIWPGPAILFALASFGVLHYGITAAKPVEPETSLMNQIIKFFRLVFYVCMTMLVTLILIRTSVMTYHDFTQPNREKIIFGIGRPKN